jgi:hypothetical protein
MKFKYLTILLLAVGTLALAPASSAWAALVSGGGEFQVTSAEVTSQRQAGPNTVTTVRLHVTFTGTFAGDTVVEERDVTHPNGFTTFRGTVTCACTIGGRSGTAVTYYEGKNQNGTLSGNYTIKGGSGDLETVKGGGTFVGDAQTGHAMYTIEYKFT